MPDANKVILGDEVLIDLTSDTVSAETMLQGTTAHDASGRSITGKVVVVPIDSELSTTSENPVQNKVVTTALNNKENKSTELTKAEYDALPDAKKNSGEYYITDWSPDDPLVPRIDKLEDDVIRLSESIMDSTESPLSNSTNGNIRAIKLVGNSHKSANILKNSAVSQTKNGLTHTVNKDGSITVNGTATANTTMIVGEYQFKSGVTYRLTGCPSGGSYDTKYSLFVNAGSSILGAGGFDSGKGLTFTPINDGTTTIQTRIVSGFVADNIVFKPMLTTDTSKTYSDYEPYGIISPSGDVVTQSKNLINKSSASGTRYETIILSKPLPIGTYTFSANVTSSDTDSTTCRVYFGFDSALNTGQAVQIERNGRKSVTVTTTSEVVAIAVYAGSTYANSASDTFSFTDIMISEGTEATDYVPYGKSTAHTDKGLYSVNDLKNVLTVFADGSGKFEQKVKADDFGSVIWAKVGEGQFYTNGFSVKKETKNILCEKYEVEEGAFWQHDKRVFVSGSGYMCVYDSAYSDATAFKNSMNGVKALYELATPTTTDLTASEVAELLSLKTFDGTTYIDTDGAEFEVSYFADTKIGEAVASVDAKVDGLLEKVSDYEQQGFLSTNKLRNNTVLHATSGGGSQRLYCDYPVHMKAGKTYYISCYQSAQVSTSTRNTLLLTTNKSTYIYESDATNYNQNIGRRVWEYDCTTDGDYYVGVWCNAPSANVDYYDWQVSEEDIEYLPYAPSNTELQEEVDELSPKEKEVVVIGTATLNSQTSLVKIGKLVVFKYYFKNVTASQYTTFAQLPNDCIPYGNGSVFFRSASNQVLSINNYGQLGAEVALNDASVYGTVTYVSK